MEPSDAELDDMLQDMRRQGMTLEDAVEELEGRDCPPHIINRLKRRAGGSTSVGGTLHGIFQGFKDDPRQALYSFIFFYTLMSIYVGYFIACFDQGISVNPADAANISNEANMSAVTNITLTPPSDERWWWTNDTSHYFIEPDLFTDVMIPGKMMPWWMLPIVSAVTGIVQFKFLGFDLAFKEKKHTTFNWIKDACIKGAFLCLALNGWKVDVIRAYTAYNQSDITLMKWLLVVGTWLQSSNFLKAQAFWMSMRIQSPAQVFQLHYTPKYKSCLFGYPSLPFAVSWLHPVKWLYGVILFPYLVPIMLIQIVVPSILVFVVGLLGGTAGAILWILVKILGKVLECLAPVVGKCLKGCTENCLGPCLQECLGPCLKGCTENCLGPCLESFQKCLEKCVGPCFEKCLGPCCTDVCKCISSILSALVDALVGLANCIMKCLGAVGLAECLGNLCLLILKILGFVGHFLMLVAEGLMKVLQPLLGQNGAILAVTNFLWWYFFTVSFEYFWNFFFSIVGVIATMSFSSWTRSCLFYWSTFMLNLKYTMPWVQLIALQAWASSLPYLATFLYGKALGATVETFLKVVYTKETKILTPSQEFAKWMSGEEEDWKPMAKAALEQWGFNMPHPIEIDDRIEKKLVALDKTYDEDFKGTEQGGHSRKALLEEPLLEHTEDEKPKTDEEKGSCCSSLWSLCKSTPDPNAETFQHVKMLIVFKTLKQQARITVFQIFLLCILRFIVLMSAADFTQFDMVSKMMLTIKERNLWQYRQTLFFQWLQVKALMQSHANMTVNGFSFHNVVGLFTTFVDRIWAVV